VRRIADRVVPHQVRNPRLPQQQADAREAGLERQIRALAQVEHPIFGINGWRIRVDQCPTSVEDAGAKRLWDIHVLEIRCTERCYEQHELQIRHPGISDIQLWHGRALWLALRDRVNGIDQGYCSQMVTISLMGQLQTADGERDLACEVSSPLTVRQVIQRQGVQLRHLLQLIREKKVLVTINKKIASDDSLVHDGDAIRLVGHDGFGGSGLGPSHT
jgi:hypothetical protein